MLDFHGLFPSYIALFLGGVYMEIESLRLDLNLKRKQKKTTRAAPTFSSEKKEKKKRNPEKKVFIREEGKKKKKTRDSRAATWVRRATNWVARRDLGLELISISSSSSSLSFFFFLSFCVFFRCFRILGYILAH